MTYTRYIIVEYLLYLLFVELIFCAKQGFRQFVGFSSAKTALTIICFFLRLAVLCPDPLHIAVNSRYFLHRFACATLKSNEKIVNVSDLIA
jgi:hypothetical protein